MTHPKYAKTARKISMALVAASLMLSMPRSAEAEIFPGPLKASVLRVIDGDTIEIEAIIWPQQLVRTNVRIRGIDAPETRRPDCEAERALGLQATRRVRELLEIRDNIVPPTVTVNTGLKLGQITA